MRRTFAAILLIAVLAVGAGAIATTAYQAGLATAVTQAVAGGATVVNPVIAPPYSYGYGWGAGNDHGFSFFGFLGTLLLLFIVFGLIRAVVWGGRHHRGPGGGGHGRGWGPGWDPASRFEDWHRQAHDGEPPTGRPGQPPGATPTG